MCSLRHLFAGSLKGKLVSAVLVCVVAISGHPLPLDGMLLAIWSS